MYHCCSSIVSQLSPHSIASLFQEASLRCVKLPPLTVRHTHLLFPLVYFRCQQHFHRHDQVTRVHLHTQHHLCVYEQRPSTVAFRLVCCCVTPIVSGGACVPACEPACFPSIPRSRSPSRRAGFALGAQHASLHAWLPGVLDTKPGPGPLGRTCLPLCGRRSEAIDVNPPPRP